MKNTIHEIGNAFLEFFRRFGGVLTLIISSYMAKVIFTEGANKGAFLRNIVKIPMAALIGLPCYILLMNHTYFDNDTCVAVSCVSCAFTGEIYDGILKLIKWIPEVVKLLISKRLNIDNEKKKENE
jgi:hypothetical protein